MPHPGELRGSCSPTSQRLELMQRLAALVPRPRLHLIRFHGVLAPNAKLRAHVVPQEPEPPMQAAPPSGSAELGQAAQARVRDRHGALPELRGRADDHRGDSGAAGDREDPRALGSGGPDTAACASPSVTAVCGEIL